MTSSGLITVFNIAFYTRYNVVYSYCLMYILFLELGAVFILRKILIFIACIVIISLKICYE